MTADIEPGEHMFDGTILDAAVTAKHSGLGCTVPPKTSQCAI